MLLECVEVVVEGEAQVIETPGSHCAFGPVQHAQVAHLGPAFRAQGMQQVEVHLALQSLGLLIEQPVEVVRLFHQPARQLGRHFDPLAVTIAQRAAHQHLALRAVIAVRGVHVVHAVIDRITEHGGCQRLIDVARVFPDMGQAHRAETERRGAPVEPAKSPVLHLTLPQRYSRGSCRTAV